MSVNLELVISYVLAAGSAGVTLGLWLGVIKDLKRRVEKLEQHGSDKTVEIGNDLEKERLEQRNYTDMAFNKLVGRIDIMQKDLETVAKDITEIKDAIKMLPRRAVDRRSDDGR